ncbi:MAG: ATP-binding protein [Candidatus Altiarchaeales archaeon]|nr:ATP-binding protein [Candidatus Altiarchaeales archaeon]
MFKDVLLLQKKELEKKLKEEYVERDAEIREIKSDIIKVIIGPRRAGKSFFALHELGKAGNFGYVNFDDEKLVSARDYDEIITAVNSIYHNPKYLLLDEIQNLDRWELFVNRLQRQGYNLVITGSNSRLLSSELSTHLTGRHSQISIFPFSFKEIVKKEGEELTATETKEKLLHYLTYGGYPEPTVKKLDYDSYLSTLFDSVVYKDIVKRYRIRSTQGMDDLALYLMSNTAKEFSHSTLAKVTKCKSVHTVEKYLKYLEESFLLFRINRFSYKVREQVASNKKVYSIDNGLIHAKAFKLGSDTGRLYENAVAAELKRMEVDGYAEVYYWKNQQQEEVDFIVKKEGRVRQLIQVCYDVNELETKKREERALLKAGKELKCKNLLIITGDYEAVEEAGWYDIKGRIEYKPLWKWLLQSPKTG